MMSIAPSNKKYTGANFLKCGRLPRTGWCAHLLRTNKPMWEKITIFTPHVSACVNLRVASVFICDSPENIEARSSGQHQAPTRDGIERHWGRFIYCCSAVRVPHSPRPHTAVEGIDGDYESTLSLALILGGSGPNRGSGQKACPGRTAHNPNLGIWGEHSARAPPNTRDAHARGPWDGPTGREGTRQNKRTELLGMARDGT